MNQSLIESLKQIYRRRERAMSRIVIGNTVSELLNPESSGATALQGLGRQSGRRRSAKLVFRIEGVSRGQRNGSPRPLISVYRTWIATYFIQVAPQLTSRGSRG